MTEYQVRIWYRPDVKTDDLTDKLIDLARDYAFKSVAISTNPAKDIIGNIRFSFADKEFASGFMGGLGGVEEILRKEMKELN